MGNKTSKQLSEFADWSLSLGLLALIPIAGQLAIIFGILALIDISKNKNKYGKNRSIFGIISGSIFTLFHFWVIWSIFWDFWGS
jgi:hypothetical protein